jgi:hypothetical protein
MGLWFLGDRPRDVEVAVALVDGVMGRSKKQNGKSKEYWQDLSIRHPSNKHVCYFVNLSEHLI